jgi:hypothetical protein
VFFLSLKFDGKPKASLPFLLTLLRMTDKKQALYPTLPGQGCP